MVKRFQFRLRTLLLAVVPVAVVALGLGWYLQRPRPIPVRGTVTLGGQPIGGVQVLFHPVDPSWPAAAGVTDSKGFFKLKPRAYGFYAVTIFGTRYAPRGMVIPGGYADAVTSGLTAEITRDGPNVFTFDLTSLPDK